MSWCNELKHFCICPSNIFVIVKLEIYKYLFSLKLGDNRAKLKLSFRLFFFNKLTQNSNSSNCNLNLNVVIFYFIVF